MFHRPWPGIVSDPVRVLPSLADNCPLGKSKRRAEARGAKRKARGAGRGARGARRGAGDHETTGPRDHGTTDYGTAGAAWRLALSHIGTILRGARRGARGARRKARDHGTTDHGTTDHGPRTTVPRTTDHGPRTTGAAWHLVLGACRGARGAGPVVPWSVVP